jgi:hypothetical protein
MTRMQRRLLGLATLFAALLCACGGNTDPMATSSAPQSDGDDLPFVVTNCSTPLKAPNPPESPAWQLDPIGPLVDVTCDWQRYQPAEVSCVKLDGIEYAPGGVGVLTDGSDPACQFSGFAEDETGLYRVEIPNPILCAGCRRMFIDFARIPADSGLLYYAHGHAFYHVSSLNPFYTIEPVSHSPNTKNFYNDKLVSPPGTPVETLIGAIDTHDMAYVTDTKYFVHTAIQGPHYIGPWYVNRDGERIHGIYLDVNVGDAMSLGSPQFDQFFYQVGYNSGQVYCNPIAPATDADILYGGCVDRPGGSRDAYDPFL